ncbi:DUF1707 domain-containing protein [Mycobacterium sp. PS03-16]|uniref:DUF1707 SHOCT-like domain-containing protein n=1 Tax=Mycobacterium sp. PS03-16 TaxID=2559611 RepID=UPI00107499EF|nr:DUF1707 domain-containing protein [Mycobacterium sp. PS03-16]TFV57225.1 DUF1707 domain-containing protein [Mycobacterium sp. PS03-16]
MGTGDAHMRISDADRTGVRRILERAVGEGMLTLDEYSDRVDHVLAARTRGDLDAVLHDLPFGRAVAPATAPAQLRARMTTVSRKGRWTVPPRISLNTRMCDTSLDFRSAVLQSSVVEIEVDDYCSSTEIIVPDDATADIAGIETVAGSATVRVAASPPSPRLHVVLRGRVRMGSVTVRHPFGAALRRFTAR